jgi:hypothetical protein
MISEMRHYIPHHDTSFLSFALALNLAALAANDRISWYGLGLLWLNQRESQSWQILMNNISLGQEHGREQQR